MIWVLAIIVVVSVITLLLGIWLGRTYCKPLPNFKERAKEHWERRKNQIDSELTQYEIAERERVRLNLTQLYNDMHDRQLKHKDFMADMALSEATERNRVSGIFIELDTKINQKRDQIAALERERAQLVKTSKEYEQNLVSTKLRIIKNYKYAKDAELRQLQDEYTELMEETTSAINLVKAKLAEWSNAERIAYEERMSREEVAKLNRLGLSDLSISEIVELHSACSKMRLANPVPLYKAIYEIYFRGPVKELGIKLNAAGVCGIYKITNVVNGKVYVGQSVDIAERWKQHIKRGTKCEVGTLAGAGLYEAMFTEGVWNFSFQVLEECEKDQLTAREKFWISHYQSNEIGYNKKV